MNDINVSVKGWVANEVEKLVSKHQKEYTSFKLASTPRYLSKDGEWEDGKTEWINIAIFNDPFLENIVSSIKKGDPIIVTGKLVTDEYSGEDGILRRNLAIRPDAIGHNLRYGKSNFQKNKLFTDISKDNVNVEFENKDTEFELVDTTIDNSNIANYKKPTKKKREKAMV
jgi:single-strand DNA-binding protein